MCCRPRARVGDGPFTVFAPTDDAFAALPAGTVESLLLPENLTTLQDILKYHVVPAKVLSTDLTLNQHATTLEGSDVTVTSLDPVKINESEVIQADVMASNGVIHVLDAVLLPPAAPGSAAPGATATSGEGATVSSGEGAITASAPAPLPCALPPPPRCAAARSKNVPQKHGSRATHRPPRCHLEPKLS